MKQFDGLQSLQQPLSGLPQWVSERILQQINQLTHYEPVIGIMGKFGLTVKDLCRPGTVVTFKPNQKKPEYDDLVALYQGKELFRYRRF